MPHLLTFIHLVRQPQRVRLHALPVHTDCRKPREAPCSGVSGIKAVNAGGIESNNPGRAEQNVCQRPCAFLHASRAQSKALAGKHELRRRIARKQACPCQCDDSVIFRKCSNTKLIPGPQAVVFTESASSP